MSKFNIRYFLTTAILFSSQANAWNGYNYENKVTCKNAEGEVRVDTYTATSLTGEGTSMFVQIVLERGAKQQAEAVFLRSTVQDKNNKMIIPQLTGNTAAEPLELYPAWFGASLGTRVQIDLEAKSVYLVQGNASVTLQFDSCN